MSTIEQKRPAEANAAGDAATMRAIVQDEYGTVAEDVLRLDEIAIPEIGEDEVLVRVDCAGVGRDVWHLMTGLPYPVRLAGYGLRAPKGRVRGADVSGRVAAVGRNVTTMRAGDEVFGIADGSFAEYARADAGKLAPKPANVSFEQAAAVPVAALAALQGLRDHARVQAGQRVLIVGASGGVGSFAVQIAKAFGAGVTGVAGTTKLDLVRSLGADDVIDYTRQSLADAGGDYDVIFDIAGNRRLSELRRELGARGTLIIVGGENGGRWLGGTDRQIRALMLSPFVGHRLGTFISSENADDLLALRDLIESGEVTPAIDRSFPLAEAAAAIRYVEEGRARGKVVVTV